MFQTVATLVIVAGTLALVVLRPRRSHEAFWTVLGAALLLAFGFVTPREAVLVTLASKDILLFLAALLLLSALVERSGFFDWAAVGAARRARGDGVVLFRNTFLLGWLITTTLSLDTTAVMLTPLVLAFVSRLRLPPAPYVIACALVANGGSLGLPISNLTNLLFADKFGTSFAHFAARMALPQIAVMLTLYWLCRWRYRALLRTGFDPRLLESKSTTIAHPGYFRAAVVVLGLVLVGYFAASFAGIAPYVIAFIGVGVLAAYGMAVKRVDLELVRSVPWGIFPFVFGLFIVVTSLERLGLAGVGARMLAGLPDDSLARILGTAFGTTVASNVMNNLPAALVARNTLAATQAGGAEVYSALLGLNVGSNILPFGSLATMLVLEIGRKKGHGAQGWAFTATGIWMAPLAVLVGSLVLAATYAR